jgi:hypothetical protein
MNALISSSDDPQNSIKAGAAPLVPLPKQPAVELVVTANDGRLVLTVVGVNPHLAALLEQMSQMADDQGLPIKKRQSDAPMAQDIFEVQDHALAAALLQTFYTKKRREIMDTLSYLSAEDNYSFVVSY